MKWLITTLVCVALFSGEALGQDKGAPPEPKDKVGYSVGYQIGADFKNHKIAIDPESLSQGASDALNDRKALLKPEEMRTLLIDLQKRMGERRGLLTNEGGEVR
jgi:hypothetical protein